MHGLDRLPATLPARREAVGRPDRALGGCGAAWRTRCATAACPRRCPTASSRPRRSTAAAGRRRPARCVIANPLSDGPERDAAAAAARACWTPRATTPPTTGPTWPCSSPRTSTAPRRCRRPCPATGRRSPARGLRPPTSATTSAPCWPAPRPAAGARRRCRPTSTRCAACWRRVLAAAGVDWRAEPGRRPYLHPGRTAAILAGATGRSAGSGELHPLVARDWDLGDRPAAAFELDVDALAVIAAEAARLPGRDQLPGGAAGHRRGGARGRAGQPRAAGRAPTAGASCCASARVFDLYHGEQAGRGAQVAGAAAGVPRPRPHAHRRRGGRRTRSAIETALARDRGAAPCLAVAVLGAAGYGGALCAAIVHEHPALELTAVTARSRRRRASRRALPALPRPADHGGARRRPGRRAGRRRAGGLPARGRGAGGARAARARAEGGRPVGRLPARTGSATSAGTSRTRRPSCSARRSTGCPSCAPRRDRARPTWWPRRAATRRPRCWRCAPLREHRADAVVDAKSGVSGAGREATAETHFVSRRRERQPLQGRGPPPPRRARAGAAGPGDRSRSCRTCCRSTRACWPRCYVTVAARGRRDEVVALFEDAYARRAVRRGRRRAARTAADVRETNLARVYATVDAAGRVLAFAAIDNLWKGAAGQAVQDLNLMLGLPEDGGAARDASSARAGCERARARARARAAPRCRRASARRASPRASSPTGLDVGVLVSDSPATASAARFTANARVGAPVMVSRERATWTALRAVVGQLGRLQRGRRPARPRHRARRAGRRPPRRWRSTRARWAWPRPG